MEEIMKKDDITKELRQLIQLDIDAVHAYNAAIKKIEEEAIRSQLTSFRDEHQQHITSLSAALREIGGTPPEFSPDFKGYIISGFTSLRSLTGTKGALKAMFSNEKLTNEKYSEAIGWDVQPFIKTIITQNLEDERRHLSYIEGTIETMR
jgi:uncharacterized protein (TIGR02284 family)